MEADLVGLGRREASTLLGPDVDDDRALQLERLAERREERPDVVTGHEPDVGDPEVLEQLARLDEVDDRCAKPLAQLADGRADDRDPADELVVGGLARLPGPRQLDLAEVLRQATDRGADRHLVVVEDDEELGLALADVVERLEAEAARDRRVADDDGDPLEAVAQVPCRRQPLADRQPGPGVPAVEDVVLRLGPSREAADAADRSQRSEPLEAAGQQLVRVGLVAGVPDDPVARRLEKAMERDRRARRRRASYRGGRRSSRRSR